MTFFSGSPPQPERTSGLIRLLVGNRCQLQNARFNEVLRRLGVLPLLLHPRRSHVAPREIKNSNSLTKINSKEQVYQKTKNR